MATTLPAESLAASAVAAPAGASPPGSEAAATVNGSGPGTIGSGPAALARARRAWLALRLFAVLLLLALLSSALVVVPPGERGVLLRWGAIQERVLREGVQLVLPLVETMRPMSVRLRSQILRSEAACRDMQDVAFQLAVHWRLPPEQVAAVYRSIGDELEIVNKVITPALEDGLKQVVAGFTAEQLIRERAALKGALEALIGARLEQDRKSTRLNSSHSSVSRMPSSA